MHWLLRAQVKVACWSGHTKLHDYNVIPIFLLPKAWPIIKTIKWWAWTIHNPLHWSFISTWKCLFLTFYRDHCNGTICAYRNIAVPFKVTTTRLQLSYHHTVKATDNETLWYYNMKHLWNGLNHVQMKRQLQDIYHPTYCYFMKTHQN